MEETFEAQFNLRVTSTLDSLEMLSRTAKASAESGKDAREMVGALDKVGALFTMADETDTQVLARLIEVHALLSAQAGTDRTEGDALAGKVRGMLAAGVDLADEVTTRAEQVLAGWTETAPKGTRKSGGSTRASQGVKVEMHCSCGWVERDSTDTNSARWTWTKHLASKHDIKGTGSGDRVKKGEHPAYETITSVVDPVSKGTETRTEGTIGDLKVWAIVDPS